MGIKKWDLQSHQSPEAKRYLYKGPAKPPMPKNDSKFQVLSLKFLASVQVSLDRAMVIDFHFVQLIADDVKVLKTMVRAQRLPGKLVKICNLSSLSYIFSPDKHESGWARHYLNKNAIGKGSNWTLRSNEHHFYKRPAFVQDDNTGDMVAAKRIGKLLFLERMHLLMSFTGCIGNLMENTGLSNILNAAFGDVHKMLLGKYFLHNIRALCMAIDEIIRPVLLDCVLLILNDLMSYMEGLASKSCTAKLWLDWPVWQIFIALRFIQCSCEADC